MKKVIRIILIVVLVLVIVGIGGCAAVLHIIKDRNTNYYKYATPVGEIEKKYTSLGNHEVSYAEFDADDAICEKYEIWYPADIESSESAFPLVVMVNGTGVKASQYKEVMNHLASWGFIVVGNEDANSRTGQSSAEALDYILSLNGDDKSIFYGKVDVNNIGIAGHSQGGVGAINAVTEQENGHRYKALFAASATSRYHADEMNQSDSSWSCDPAKIEVPIFMVAGTNLMDAGNVNEYTSGTLSEGEAQGICPLWWLNECYDSIPDSVSKVIARQVNKDHGDMLRGADAYMTAWFMYWLKGDSEAGKVFVSTEPELLTNSNYQDVKINQK